MNLFTRKTHLTTSEGVEWATKICGLVNDLTGQSIELWAKTYSPGFGDVGWTGWFDDLSALEAFTMSLPADASYVELAGAGAEHTDGTFDDSVLEVVAGELDPSADPQIVSGVEAVVAGGSVIRAMGAGVEIAERATAATGANALFLQALTGPYGGIGWLTGYPDMASVEAGLKAMAADPGWLELIDSTEGCFVEDPAITQQTLYRKLA